jgi:hypothetical protein
MKNSKYNSFNYFLIIFIFSPLLMINASTIQTKNNSVEKRIIELIKQKQKDNVRISYTEYNCFTDVDLQNFNSKKTVDKICSQLRNSKEINKIIIELNKMNKEDLAKLFDNASNTYKKTWAELGEITPKGQTDAGQTAEKMIAERIVTLIKEMLNK